MAPKQNSLDGDPPDTEALAEIRALFPDLAVGDSPLDEARLKELQAKYAIRVQIADQILRDRELRLKERNSKFEKWTNPLTVALIAGAAGLLGTVLNGIGANSNERTKLRNDLIKEAIKPASEQERAKSLVFFANNHLIELDASVIKSLEPIAGNSVVPGSSGSLSTSSFRPRALTSDELNGFVIHVVRTRVEQREGRKRTIGSYHVTYAGQDIPHLKGFTAESSGPGDNYTVGSGRRLQASGYPLSTWFGTNYVTLGYSTANDPTVGPKPAIAIDETGLRQGIIIHPGRGFLSSVGGTINLSKPLDGPGADIDYTDSRQRVIELITAMNQKLGSQSLPAMNRRIPNAWVIISGEPGTDGEN